VELRAEHLTAKEIARDLGISPHTVFMHWHLARAKLRLEPIRRRRIERGHDAAPSGARAGDRLELAAIIALLLVALLTLLGVGDLLTVLALSHL
jgi:DNA-binding NarL/FixJ family response regulator